MKIYKLTFEEIDTEDKDNVLENQRLTSQIAVSQYELSMCQSKRQKEIYKDLIKHKLFEEMQQRIF